MSIRYNLIGQGVEQVIVLHGWFGDHSVFRPLFPFLNLDRFTYAFVDYRGYGKSKDISGEYTIEEIAADVLALTDELGWSHFHLIGHSMGGMVMQRIIADASAKIRSAVAVTAVPASGIQQNQDEEKLFEEAVDKDKNRFNIINFSTGERLSSCWVNSIVQLSRDTTKKAAFAGYCHSFRKTDFSSEIAGNPISILVCAGEYDRALTREIMEETFMKWYPNAELKILGNSGHYPMQEIPVSFVTEIESFLKKNS